MSENKNESLSSPSPIEQGGTSPEQTKVQEIGKSLSLPEEVIGKIEKLPDEQKELCLMQLEELQKEITSKGYTSETLPQDIKDKVKDTLGDYGINSRTIEGGELRKQATIEGGEITNILVQAVENNVKEVKRLSPLVDSELKSLKETSPLPDTVAEKIAEKTGSTKEEVLQGEGKNTAQIKNLVDAYYLSSETLANNVISKLPDNEKQQADTTFRNLRSSMNAAEIPPYPVTADKVGLLLRDKSNKTQELVTSTVSSLTHPDTLITRTGDQLNWEGTDGKKYEIDMERHPPKLSKQDGIFQVEQDIHSTEEIEKQAQTMSEYETVQQNNTILEGKVVVGYSPDTERTISESEETTHISSREIRELMDTLAKPEETLETKQTTCERLITLYGHAETLPEFQAKVNPDATEVISGLRDYFYSTKVELEALKRGYENEDTLQKRLPQTDEDILTSSTDWEANTAHNFDRLNRLGLGGFQNMDEVIGFFQNERGQVASGVWSDKASINRYLGSTKLEVSQLEGFLERLVTIYDTITGENIGEIKDKGEQRKMLQRDTGDGRTALSAALEGYRAQNGIGILHRADFERLSTQKTS